MDHDGVVRCPICLRKAKGFGYCYQARFDAYPYYQFCTKRCQDIGVLRANQGELGMIGRTERELRAIKDARKDLARTLTELGLMQPFFNRSPDDIDAIIQACIDGFQQSMVEQQAGSKEFSDEIPF